MNYSHDVNGEKYEGTREKDFLAESKKKAMIGNCSTLQYTTHQKHCKVKWTKMYYTLRSKWTKVQLAHFRFPKWLLLSLSKCGLLVAAYNIGQEPHHPHVSR